MLKQLTAIPFVQALLGRGLGAYMYFVGATTRWQRVNRAAVEPFWAPGARVIMCFWHGRFPLAHALWAFGRGVPKAKMLVSRSREGEIAGYASRTVGAELIRGSAAKGGQQKGGVEAVREMVRHIDAGGAIALTPDGPRGPRMRAKVGPVQVAKIAEVPIICLAWATRWRIVFQSWDRFVLPLPFGRGALVWGGPIAPPSPDADAAELERVRAALEAELNRVSAEADRLAGVTPIEPAPPRRGAAEPADDMQAAK